MNNNNNNKMTITEVAKEIGVVPKTIIRWEKFGKIKMAKRDWRGWRVYTQADLEGLKIFHDSIH